MLSDWKTAEIPEHVRAALRLLERMTLHPLEIDAAFVEGLRADGLDDAAIRSAANTGFHFNLINRVADAFDFTLPTGKAKQTLARVLNLAGKTLKGPPEDEIWTRGEDGRIRPSELELAREHMYAATGETSTQLRLAIEGFVFARWGDARPDAPALPADLEGYLGKLALHAYRIVDEDLDALREAGYSKDAIYEITIVGSFAAGLVGIEHLFEAMYGGAPTS